MFFPGFKGTPFDLSLNFINYTFTDLAFNFNDKDCDIEQHITIIPNPRRGRRGSMADHAFPELHSSRSKQKEPENLLILTRTKTDRHGRRHSVAVPLIPPPDGEKFEGGYHVERNPVTGGAKLVPPPGGKCEDSWCKQFIEAHWRKGYVNRESMLLRL